MFAVVHDVCGTPYWASHSQQISALGCLDHPVCDTNTEKESEADNFRKQRTSLEHSEDNKNCMPSVEVGDIMQNKAPATPPILLLAVPVSTAIQ